MDQRRVEESRQVTALLTTALGLVAAHAAVSAFAAWMSTAVLSSGSAVARGGQYVAGAFARIRMRRTASYELTIAAYRLVMALRTGTTLAVEGLHEPGRTSLQQLRQEFHDAVQRHAPEALQSDPDTPTLPEGPEGDGDALGDNVGPPTGTVTPDDHAPGEVLWEDEFEPDIPNWVMDDWSDYEAEVEAEAIRLAAQDAAEEAEWERVYAEEASALAAQEYAERLRRAQEEARQRQADQDAAREEERRKMGRRLAAIEAKHARNAGRRAADELLAKDKRAVGVARYSPGGCCAFCGVLMLRGPHYKKPYPPLEVHTNCDCDYVALYSATEYGTDPRFNWNRFLVTAYDEGAPNRNSKPNSNKGLNALRRHLYQRRKLARS